MDHNYINRTNSWHFHETTALGFGARYILCQVLIVNGTDIKELSYFYEIGVQKSVYIISESFMCQTQKNQETKAKGTLSKMTTAVLG